MTLLPSAVFAACALAAIPALAQPQDRTPPAPAVADASMAPRVAACTACHGAEGRATNHGYFPRIAGKPEGYLFNQLVNFRDGRRHYAPMAHLLRNLDDGYPARDGRLFRAPAPAVPAAADPPALRPRCWSAAANWCTLATRRWAIPACVQCHGERMTGVAPFIPGLLGLPRDYLNAQLGAFKNGLRKAHAPNCMAQHLRAPDARWT